MQVGACGDDEWGDLFLNSLKRAGVATDRVRCLPGPTGRAVILTSRTSGQRTMRTNLVSTHSLTSDMLEDKDFLGSQWWELGRGWQRSPFQALVKHCSHALQHSQTVLHGQN